MGDKLIKFGGIVLAIIGFLSIQSRPANDAQLWFRVSVIVVGLTMVIVGAVLKRRSRVR